MFEVTSKLYFRVVFLALLLPLISGDCVNLDLGMGKGTIPDRKITASSSNATAKNGRLNFASGSSWCAATSDTNPYLQIDLQTLHIICPVSTQGNSQADQWVTNYTLQSSTDGSTWIDYTEIEQVKTLRGNSDRNSEVKHILYEGVLARYLRFLPKTHHGGVCMRTEVFGVKQKPENLAHGKPTTQSSTFNTSVSGKAVDGNPGHCSHTLEDNPSWWRVDLGSAPVPVFEINIINRLITSSNMQKSSEDYKITFGSSSDVAENPECRGLYSFIDFTASALCFTNPLKTGRYVENLAFGKTTHQSSTQHDAASSRAVDGNSQTDYTAKSCTHTTTTSKPWWRVDLGQEEPVSEVYIVNRDALGNRLSKFEIRVGSTTNGGNPKCGDTYGVPEGSGLSFFCRPPLYGRYVTIISLLTIPLTLCEVEVYSEKRACQIQALGVTSRDAFPDNSFSASSSNGSNAASKGRLNKVGAWSPGNDTNPNDYLQINLEYEFFICAVATQGKHDLINHIDNDSEDGSDHSYNLDCCTKHYIFNLFLVFHGNSGRNDIVKHNLKEIARARFIRFQPTSYSTRKALRVEVFGILKPAAPSQAPGSFAVTPLSSTSVRATWQLPPADSRHGVITGFKLLYGRKGSAADSLTILTIEDNSTLTRDVTGLRKCTEYEFQVLAFTYVGNGQKSSVQPVTTFGLCKPVIRDLPKRTVFAVGELAILTCEVSGDPEPYVVWSKDGDTNIPRAQFRNNGHVLVIQEVLPVDSGVYECKASNKFGKNRTSTRVIVARPPIIIEDISPPSATCERQALCSFSCHATSDTPFNYSWTKDDQVPVGDDIQIINNSIVLRPQSAKDYGVYVCHVTNSFGSTAYKITLSEGHKCSTTADTIKGDNNVNSIFNAYSIALSCVVFVLLVVIGVLIWRLRRAVPHNRTTTTDKIITDDIGKPDLPRDQHMSVPDSYMELHPRPSESQSFSPPDFKSAHDTNKNPGYYNLGLNKGNDGNDNEETYEEIMNDYVYPKIM
ncbi:hypothetical protein ACROYT_G043230 [Oculina patagonica]